MNWFDILKEQRQVSRNIQSFKPIQLSKPIKLNKPKETTCRDKLIDLYKKALNSFPDGKRRDENLSNEHYDLSINHEFAYEGGKVFVKVSIPNEGVLPDEAYCLLLKEFERVEKAGPGSSGSISYDYIDYNLKEPKFVVADSEMWYTSNNEMDDAGIGIRYGVAQLAFYTYILDSPILHPGHTVLFSVSSEFKDKTIEEGISAYTGSPILRYNTFRDIKTWRGLF